VQVGATSPDTANRADDGGVQSQLLARIPQVAAMLDVSADTVKRLIRSGELPTVKVAGARRVRCSDLEAYVERLTQQETSTT
jgi:excisionase family DNA binding protein